MKFPPRSKLDKIIEKLNKVDSYGLPENPTIVEKTKFIICEKFVKYLLKTKTTQVTLARELGMDPARLNEIVRYRIDLFTIDKLLVYAEKLDPKIKIKVI